MCLPFQLPYTLFLVPLQLQTPATDAVNCTTARSRRLPSKNYAQIIILHNTYTLRKTTITHISG